MPETNEEDVFVLKKIADCKATIKYKSNWRWNFRSGVSHWSQKISLRFIPTLCSSAISMKKDLKELTYQTVFFWLCSLLNIFLFYAHRSQNARVVGTPPITCVPISPILHKLQAQRSWKEGAIYPWAQIHTFWKFLKSQTLEVGIQRQLMGVGVCC